MREEKIEIEINERTLRRVDSLRRTTGNALQRTPGGEISRGELIDILADLVQPMAVAVQVQSRITEKMAES